MNVIVIYIILFAIAVLARSLTCIVHEIGHAIPALILTNKDVAIYIGTYGTSDGTVKLNLGRVKIYFKYNLFHWYGGVCIHGTVGSYSIKNLIITLGGPILSLVSGFTFVYVAFYYDSHGFIKLLASIFSASSLLDFIFNISFKERIIKLDNGQIGYTDGFTIKRILEFWKKPPMLRKAHELYNNDEFKEAALLFNTMLDQDFENIDKYRFLISCYAKQKEWKKAIQGYERMERYVELDEIDFQFRGYLWSRLKDYEKSNANWTLAIQLNPNLSNAYNNRGYNYNLMELYEEALSDFNISISLNPNNAYAYNNRGYAKLFNGNSECGYKDIQKSILLDDMNAYAYRNLGIYYYKQKEVKLAHHFFLQAEQIDSDIDLLQSYIQLIKKELE